MFLKRERERGINTRSMTTKKFLCFNHYGFSGKNKVCTEPFDGTL